MSNNFKFNNSINSSHINSLSQVDKLIKTDKDKLSWFLTDPDDFMRYRLLMVNGELNAAGRVFAFLVANFNSYPVLFFSQKTIAKKLGLDRMTVNQSIKKLHKYGFINKIYRTNHPCLYGLPSHFRAYNTRKYLSKYITAFKCITLALLLSTVSHMVSKDQYLFILEKAANIKEIKYKYNNYLKTERRMLVERLEKATQKKFTSSIAPMTMPGERKNVMQLITNTQKRLKMSHAGDGTHEQSLDVPKTQDEEMTYNLDQYLQKVVPTDEIERIKRKLALITPVNKKSARYMGFSRAAEVSNAIFPDEAINYAAQNTPKNITGEPRFTYFFKMCMLYCAENQITIHPNTQQKMHTLFKIPITDPKVKINTLVMTPTMKPKPITTQKYKEDYKTKQSK